MLKSSPSRKTWLAWVMLGIGLLATVFASLQVKQGIEQDAVRQLAFTCDQVTLKIQQRLDAYALILRGGAALFAATNKVGRREWRTYVETLRADGDIPGIQGLGFAQAVPSDQLAAHIIRIRGEGFPDYTVRPPGERSLYTPVVYLEPFRDRNLRAFGFDMYSEPVSRAAMEQACDTGEAALSGKVELVQETGVEVQSGALMYVPVYRNGAAVGTVVQRREALLGWVYSPYRMNDLLTGILGDWESREGRTIDLHIYDNLLATPANLLFDSKPANLLDVHSLLHQQRTIDFNGRQWLLVFDRTSTASGIGYAPAWAALVGGLSLSGMLFWLMISVVNTRADAARIAAGLTEAIRHHEAALQDSEEKIHLLLDSTAEGIYGIDINGDCTFCNESCLRLLGYRYPEELLGKNMHWQIHGKYADGSPFPVEESRIFQAFSTGELIHVDNEVLWRSDGSSFPAEYWSYPQYRGGVVVGAVVSFMDITERKRLEEMNTQSRNLLLTVIDTAPVRIFWKDLNLRYLGCNRDFAKDAGMMHPQDVIGKDDYQMGWAAQAESYHADDRAVIESGIAKLSYSEPQPTPNGQANWLRSSKVPLRNQDNEVFGVMGVYENITELKRMQDDLALREAEIRATLYSIADAVISQDINGCVVLMNPVAEQLTGWGELEAHGKRLEEVFCIVNEETRSKIDNPLRVLNETDIDGMTAHVLLIARDGTERSIGYSHSPIFDQDFHLLGDVLVFRDLTKEREVEQTILNQLAIIETYDGLVALANLDGKLIYVNAGGIKLLGSTQADAILAKNITDFIEQTNLERETDELIPVAIRDGAWHGEQMLKRIDGTSIPVSQTIFSIRDAEGNHRHMGIIMADISLQKELQHKLLISEKLAIMGRMLAEVSHELNNPLAIVIGRTELILSHLDGQSTPFKANLEVVLQSARRCKTILGNLLTYGRTIGKKEGAVNLPDLIREAVDAVNYQYDMSAIEVTVHCNLPTNTEITGNKVALLSVFVNLIRNARQAMVKTGKLTIAVAKEDESQLRIEIQDTGIGISQEKLKNIFQPFISGWVEGEGTGLGLSTSHGIIETHGGKMWVESEGEGKGTKFTILLPYGNSSREDEVSDAGEETGVA